MILINYVCYVARRVRFILYPTDAVIRKSVPVIVERMVLTSLLPASVVVYRVHVLVRNHTICVREITPRRVLVLFSSCILSHVRTSLKYFQTSATSVPGRT